MPPVRQTAPHLRESIFRQYEPSIALAVENYPNETIIPCPDGMAFTTFIANYRNAILSLRTYNWETFIDKDRFAECCKDACAAPGDNNTIIYRKRKPIGRKPTITGSILSTSGGESLSPSPVPWKDHTDDEVRALCLLIDKGRLFGPYILNEIIPPSFEDELINRFNIAITFDRAANQTIIT